MTAEDYEHLDADRQRALTALLTSDTIAAAAKRAKLGEATLYRYLREPEFKAAYRLARAAAVEHAVTRLRRDCATASKTLREVCGDKEAPASARVTAAKAILDGAVKGVELQDLAARVEEVEKAVGTQKRGGR